MYKQVTLRIICFLLWGLDIGNSLTCCWHKQKISLRLVARLCAFQCPACSGHVLPLRRPGLFAEDYKKQSMRIEWRSRRSSHVSIKSIVSEVSVRILSNSLLRAVFFRLWNFFCWFSGAVQCGHPYAKVNVSGKAEKPKVDLGSFNPAIFGKRQICWAFPIHLTKSIVSICIPLFSEFLFGFFSPSLFGPQDTELLEKEKEEAGGYLVVAEKAMETAKYIKPNAYRVIWRLQTLDDLDMIQILIL